MTRSQRSGAHGAETTSVMRVKAVMLAAMIIVRPEAAGRLSSGSTSITCMANPAAADSMAMNDELID